MAGPRAGAEGLWCLSFEGGGFCSHGCTLFVSDVDGGENGAFQDAEVTVSLPQTDEGGGDWDEGRWEAHDIEVELDPL